MALPSIIGISEPSSFTRILSTPVADRADIRCSTVAIEKFFVPRVELSFVSVTACGFTVIFG